MLSNLKGLKIQGRKFSSGPIEFNFWENPNTRLSLIYGKNGSGKSTVSDAFSYIKNNDLHDFANIEEITFNNSEPFSNEDKATIHVFNEKFIDSNIKIEQDGINAIVMFGQQIDIDKQIKEKESKLQEKSNEIELQNSLIQEYNAKGDKKNPQYYLNLCIAELKGNFGWADTERIIKSSKVNSPVNTNTVTNIINNYNTDCSLDELTRIFSEKKKIFDSLSNNSFEITPKVGCFYFDNDDKKAISLLTKKIQKTELTEREQKIFDFIEKNGQNLLSQAKFFFNKKDSDFCPYCYQTINPNYKTQLMVEFQKVLNKEVDEYQTELNTIKKSVLTYDLTPYNQLDKIIIQAIDIEISKFNKVINKYNQLIENRINNVYKPFLESDYTISLEEAIKPLNALLEELETKRIAFNQLINNKKNLKNELLKLNYQIANKKIYDNYKKFSEQTEALKREDEKLNEITNEYNSIKKELDSLTDQKKNINIAQEHINYLLQYVFFSKNKFSIESHEGTYVIKSNGSAVKPNQISCGERNILALCYYFTELFSGMEKESIYTDPNLIIIDDPVSSFDKENRIGVLSLLKYELEHLVTGNTETKMLIMTHDLMAFYDLEKIAQELNVKKTCKYTLQEFSQKGLKQFEYKKSNEYSKLLATIYSFAQNPTEHMDNEMYIGNIMRRVIEAYSTFVYKVGIEEISFDDEILKNIPNKKQQDYFSNLMYRIILNGESHSEERMKSLEDFCNGISTEEKIRIAKDILCFLYLLNPTHISKHLQNISKAIENIKKWCKDIPA